MHKVLVDVPNTMVIDDVGTVQSGTVPLGVDHVGEIDEVLIDNLLGPASIPTGDALSESHAFKQCCTPASPLDAPIKLTVMVCSPSNC